MSQARLEIESLVTISLADLKSCANQKCAVLSVNNRLTRSIVAKFAQGLGPPQSVAEIPLIMPWSSWLPWLLQQASFENLDALPSVVLDNFASQALWVEVIGILEFGDASLLDVNQAAQAAQQADTLIDEWRLQVRPEEATEEFERFSLWRDAYRARLHAIDALDANTLIDRALTLIQTQLVQLPERVVLAGFTEFSARMSRVLDALIKAEVQVLRLHDQRNPAVQPTAISLDSPQDEWLAAALWARQALSTSPAGKFAIIAVGLQADAAHARRTLDAVLTPEKAGYTYNLAVGPSLAEWSFGRALLAWLRTFTVFARGQSATPKELAQALLAGCCAGGQAERGARALIDAGWRRKQDVLVTLADWRHQLSSLSELGPAWQLAFEAWQADTSHTDCATWVLRIKRCLGLLGFPGGQTQTTTQYQLSEALDQMLGGFARLDPVLGDIDANTALAWLDRLARSTVFQPQRDSNARLDVLGLLEAEGGQWDGVWIVGMSDEAMPAAPKPNPFIPIASLQRGNAPRATPARELEWAHKLYQHLLTSAPNIIVSVALHDGERELRASPFIPKPVRADRPMAFWQRSITPLELESLLCDRAPTVLQQEVISGGTSLLETQAKNPLWAFLRYRLHASGLQPYAILPPNTLRGDFIHGILENFWRGVPDQSSLLALIENGALHTTLVEIANAVAQQELAQLSEVLRQLEIVRAVPLIADWLVLEASRAPFTVTEVESESRLDFGAFHLKMKLDRVDEIEGGAKVVLDYKSSASLKNVTKDWNHTRPVNLQLPAYVSLLLARPTPPDIAALLLVQIHAKQDHGQSGGKAAKGIAGLAQFDIGLKGLPVFDAEKDCLGEDWRSALNKLDKLVRDLGLEFAQGVTVNESWRLDDLKYCDVKPLLRFFDEIEDD